MNENKRALYLILFIVALGAILIQTKKTGLSSDITSDEIMGHIRYLSHESRGGRFPGTRGSKDVIAYMVKNLKSYGIEPGANNSYVQPFDITSGIKLGDGNYALVNGDSLFIKTAYVDEGPVMKRFRPAAMGRATGIRKRTSHLTIIISSEKG